MIGDGDRDFRCNYQVDESRPCEVGSFRWDQFHAVARQDEIPLNGIEDLLCARSRVGGNSRAHRGRHRGTKGGTQEAIRGRAYLSWTHPQRPIRLSLRSLHFHSISERDLERARVQIQGQGGRY